MVVDALSRKAAATPILDICLSMIVTMLLERIWEAQVEGMKEEHRKCERLHFTMIAVDC